MIFHAGFVCSLESEVRVTGFQPRDPRVNSLSYTLRIFTVPLAARALRSCWWFRLRAATCVRKGSESDLSATFEDLKIQSTGDVVKHLVHTTSLAAELLRGPGGKLRGPADPSSPSSLSSEICQVLSEAQSVCKAFLPQVLRGHASVSQLLDLFVEAFAVAGQPSHASAKAFKALETPLVIFHTKAPLAMRKALQSRIVGAADAWFILIQLQLSTFLISICTLLLLYNSRKLENRRLLFVASLRKNCSQKEPHLKPIHLAFLLLH